MVHEDNPPVTSVCFAPNGRYVLAFSSDSCLRLWDYVSGSVKKTYQGHENGKFSVGGCFGILRDDDEEEADVDDHTNAITNGDDDSKNAGDGSKEENGAHSRGSRGGGRGQAFIAAASEDGDIVLWDVRTKEVVQRIRGAHDGVCFWVDVHGDTMVSAGQDGRIKVFRHERRPPHRPRRRHQHRHRGGANGTATPRNGLPADADADADAAGTAGADTETADAMSLDGMVDADVVAARDETTPLKDEDVKKEE